MDAMVTARMPQGKKDAGNAVLARLGTNASQAIGQLYDCLIETGQLPFTVGKELDSAEIARRVALVDGIPLPPETRFSTMTDDEIKRERLGL